MKQFPTLADAAIRESMRPHGMISEDLGKRIRNARKFVLDASASSFLSDLSHASYADTGKNLAVIERVRVLARIPHSTTWIEYEPRVFRARTNEIYSENVTHVEARLLGQGATVLLGKKENIPLSDIVGKIGWLLESTDQHFTLTVFTSGDNEEGAIVLPFQYHWTTDESLPPANLQLVNPDKSGERWDSYTATGIRGYHSSHVIMGTLPLKNIKNIRGDVVANLIAEFVGELRFAWALLATINDIPMGVKHVKPSKGFVAKGRYRRFFEHSVISILLPKGRDPQTVAKKVVELSRRRAHMVRGHWRRDWRNPFSPLCEHSFETVDDTVRCKICGGQKLFVHEHIRGDEKLGFVVHDYTVKHDDDNDDGVGP